MSKPAKNEAALLKRAGEAIRKALIKPPGCTESTGCAVGPCHCAHLAAEAALAAIRAAGWAVVPVEPTDGLLMSMALRADHGLGCSGYYDVPGGEPWQTHARRLEMAISEARKQHEEVVGTGFYKPECNDTYRAMLAAAPGVKP